jgi:hypothetical protein
MEITVNHFWIYNLALLITCVLLWKVGEHMFKHNTDLVRLLCTLLFATGYFYLAFNLV